MPIVLATQEAGAGGSLEVMSSRPTWATLQDGLSKINKHIFLSNHVRKLF
jgi:hypothetical protein